MSLIIFPVLFVWSVYKHHILKVHIFGIFFKTEEIYLESFTGSRKLNDDNFASEKETEMCWKIKGRFLWHLQQ